MRMLIWNLILALSLATLVSCENQSPLPDDLLASGRSVDPDSLPGPVQTYVGTNYPNETIYEAELDDECDSTVYEVELSSGLELYFDLQGTFLGTEATYDCDDDDDGYDDEDDYLDPDSLPAAVLTYISTNYPGDSIYEAERDDECDSTVYAVELSSGVELYFDLQGNFLGTDATYDCDDDDDGYYDDDDYLDPDSLPAAVLTYISTNYPGDSIYEAELDDECDSTVYAVELSSGVELYFDLQGNFLGTDATYDCDDDYVDPNSLPSAVQTYISTNYPNDSIYEVEIDDECDDDVYVVELTSGVELYFDLQGNFLGTDDDFECD